MGEVGKQRLSLGQAAATAASMLRRARIKTPELDARLLLCHAAGRTHEEMIAERDAELPPETAARFGALVGRRLTGEPVSRILGIREFYGRPFRIDASTLDPRPDTETLIEAALHIAEEKFWRDAPIRVLDLGTGSGAILVTLLAELPKASGIGVDISPPALTIARSNAEALGVGPRARFVASDWFDALDDSFDLIVANPPYLAAAEIVDLAAEVRDYDPRVALDGGADGLAAYRRIAGGLGEFLGPGGAGLAEIGFDQAEAVLGLLRQAGLGVEDGKCLWRDLAGRPRVVAAYAASRPQS
jgi:release factor glutamine methyltransferase